MFCAFPWLRPLISTTFAIICYGCLCDHTILTSGRDPACLVDWTSRRRCPDPSHLHPQGHRHKMLRNYSPVDQNWKGWRTLTGRISWPSPSGTVWWSCWVQSLTCRWTWRTSSSRPGSVLSRPGGLFTASKTTDVLTTTVATS